MIAVLIGYLFGRHSNRHQEHTVKITAGQECPTCGGWGMFSNPDGTIQCQVCLCYFDKDADGKFIEKC